MSKIITDPEDQNLNPNKYGIDIADLAADPAALIIALHKRIVIIERKFNEAMNHVSNNETGLEMLKEQFEKHSHKE